MQVKVRMIEHMLELLLGDDAMLSDLCHANFHHMTLCRLVCIGLDVSQ